MADLSDALAAIVHETRRPVALARGYVSMLQEGQLGQISDSQRSALQKIDDKLVEAIGEVERLGMLARVEQERPIAMERVDLTEQAIMAVDRGRARVELTGGQLNLEYADGGPVIAGADVSLLARILDNLVDNALAYSDGAPLVKVSIGYEGHPYLRVVDQGKGIEPELRDRVFERGFRGDPASGPGSGLGLYLCRQAALEMGGTLRLEWSEPGKGSSFRLDLQSAHGPGLAIVHRNPIR